MATPRVSIIIPCFNGAEAVGDAIRSALEQTYRPIEVIVVDDGSTDSSLDVIRSFGDAIRWHTGPNRGACAARNRGLEMAHGDLVQFLDADDLLHWNKLERQVPLALAHPDEIVYTDYLRRPCGGGEEYSLVCAKLLDDDPVVFVLRNQLIQTSAPLHRRPVLATIGGFDEALPCSQEFDLHLRLACHGLRFFRLAEALSTMRRSAHSLSSNTTRVLDQHERIIVNARELLARTGSLTERRAVMLAAALVHDARWFARWGLEDKARRFLRLARELHPSGGTRHAYGGMSHAASLVFGPVVLERFARAIGSLGKSQQRAAEADWRQAWTLVSGSAPVSGVSRRGARAVRKQWRMASFRLSEPKGPWCPSRRPPAELVTAAVDWLLRAQGATADGGVAQLYDVARAEWSP